jgi:transposase
VTEEEIDALIAGLPPEAKLVVSLLREQNAQQRAQIERLSEQIDKLQQMLFGRRSEKMPPIDKILRDAEPPTETVDGKPMPEDDKERKKEIRRRSRKDSAPKRTEHRERRKTLPVLEYVVTVRDDQLPSGMTRADFRPVGKGTVIERVEHVPARYIRQRFILETLASKDGELIIKAEAPAGVSEGCHYGPGTHAHVVTAKCCDSLPLYRVAAQLRREGNPIARSTLCSIFHRSAELLRPISDALLEAVRADGLVHADETTLPVQAEGRCTRGWVWMTMSARAISYTYAPTRSGDVAKKLLGGTAGRLVVDGYSGYNTLAESDRSRCGCWAHARRKFFEARSSAPEADEALKLIQKLYRVERQAAKREELGTSEHAKMRDKASRAIVDELEQWVAERAGRYSPKSPMGSALGYMKNHRDEFRRFLEDPLIPLDNNAAERALRIVALGRKNFLFAGHDEGAQNLAVLQSIVGTCQLHDVNPYAYIRDVLVRIQEPGVRLADLMPWAWSAHAE